MLSDVILADILTRLGLRAPVRFDEVTGSTNQTAAELARAGAPQWTLCVASHQSSGRGRLDRPWVDRPGSALLCSVVLRPSLESRRAGLLSLLGGVAMVHATRRLGVLGVACKWPNDLVRLPAGSGQQPGADGEALKVGGILSEADVEGTEVRFVVLGAGMNLLAPPPVDRAGAIEVADAADLLEAFLTELRDRMTPNETFAADVVSSAREVSATLGRRVRVTTVRGKLAVGEAVDLDELGGLIVRTGTGLETVAFGDVEFLRPQVDGGTTPR